jgi:hypothetical protein
MKRQHLRISNTVTVLVLIGIVLMMGAALCAVGVHGHGNHLDHDDHGVVLDLCLALYSAPSIIALLVALVAVGAAVAQLPGTVLPAHRHVLEPPPKHSALA